MKRTLLIAATVEAPADWSDEDIMDALRWKHDVPAGALDVAYQSGFENVQTLSLHLKEQSS